MALIFNGTGTIWFDDAEFDSSPSIPNTPLSQAVSLVDESGTPAGLVVKGPFGVDAAASLVGSGDSGEVTLHPNEEGIPEIPAMASDGAIFCIGLTESGDLKRAYLQGGTFLDVGNRRMVEGAQTGSFDLALRHDENGCASLYLTQIPTLEAPPYRIRARVSQVFVDGQRTPFAQEGDMVVFPQGSDLGPGCDGSQPTTDAGIDGSPGADAAITSDASSTESGQTTGGCGCSSRVGTDGDSPLPFLLLVLAALWLTLRRRGLGGIRQDTTDRTGR